MPDNILEQLSAGSLVLTKPMQTTHEPTTIQCWCGNTSKKQWVSNPEMLYLCNIIPKNLLGQVVDTLEFSFDGSKFFLVKLIVVIEGHVRSFWVFAQELEMVKDENYA